MDGLPHIFTSGVIEAPQQLNVMLFSQSGYSNMNRVDFAEELSRLESHDGSMQDFPITPLSCSIAASNTID